MPRIERSAASGVGSAGSFSNDSPDLPRVGKLIVVSGPSGVGKTSVVEAVLDCTGADFSVSATTRHPRPGEEHGVDYYFVDDAHFRSMQAGGELLEWAEYGGHQYGTPVSEVMSRLDGGRDVLLDIENDGAKQVKGAYPDAVLIFLLPPSLETLEGRLRARGDTSDEDIARRLAVAEAQIAEAHRVYDHLVVNDDLATAIDEVSSILSESSLPQGDSNAAGFGEASQQER